jgi:predicted  nucleic acid-binding Zn-ribbon protein
MKPKIDKIDKLESDISTINGNIDTLQSQMDDLAAQAGNLGTQLSGDVTADTTVTGLGSTDTSTEAQAEMDAIDEEDEADNPQQQADSALL